MAALPKKPKGSGRRTSKKYKLSTKSQKEIIAAVDKLFEGETRKKIIDTYKNRKFYRAEKCKDVETRFVFDILHVIKLINLFYAEDMNDDHAGRFMKFILADEINLIKEGKHTTIERELNKK